MRPNKQHHNDSTLAAYNSGVNSYITKAVFDTRGAYFEWKQKVLSYADKNKPILEVGTGPGLDVDLFESLGYQVYRTDASEAFLQHNRTHGHRAHYLNLLEPESYPENTYQLIYAAAVFLHFTPSELAVIFKNLRALLKDEGRLAFCAKAGAGEVLEKNRFQHDRYFYHWQLSELETLVEKCGYNILESEEIESDRPDRTQLWLHLICEKK